MGDYSIKIVQKEKEQWKGFRSSSLVLDISGKDVSVQLVNALRRLVVREVPCYAFHDSTIKINKNTSVYNNDMIRERVSNIPIFNVPHKIDHLEKKDWYRVDYTDPKRERVNGDVDDIDMYVTVENKTDDIMNVTTEHAQVYHNGNKVDMYKDIEPILIVMLRPGEKFEMVAKSVLGIGVAHGIFNSSWAFYNEEKSSYRFTVRTFGQIDEYQALSKALRAGMMNLTDIRERIRKTNIDDGKSVMMIIDDEDHTLGEFINSENQSRKDILASGGGKPDHLIRQYKIKYTTSGDQKKPIIGAIETCYAKFAYLEGALKGLAKTAKVKI